ncbi:23S rRNA (guanosine(2251)-2'-O)-methyltransferase RlmB [candidate division TM6 bacterium RIFCSPHIGHO2_12_FULL_32_22]|nr:MAG: 23S rRNA (guanosine(2251)-2'-O)-methyltransferase RlmB [candidate division TM6 bacterium RIFCSPHIGHO2_12_FULL_32_22]
MAKEKNLDIIFGINPIIELLTAKKRKIHSIYTTTHTPKNWDKIKQLLPNYANIQFVDKSVITKLAGTDDHQNVFAYVHPFIFRKKDFDPEKQKFLLLLDGIQDPRNLGAILRSAYCTGVQGVIITSKNSAPITATAIKSSAGLSEYLEIMVAPTAKHALLQLQKSGYSIYISTLEKAENMVEVAFSLPLCIVIGSEGVGVSKDILSLGTKVKLPQIKTDISYNASVAAGIFLFNIATKNSII